MLQVSPPIKCQGKKTKLVPAILSKIENLNYQSYYEPFFGSGSVGFNVQPSVAVFADINPHIIEFYKALFENVSQFKESLTRHGLALARDGESYFYTIRDRFNKTHDPHDFLFLTRSCFNGIMRFNSHGGFNTPFCRDPNRLTAEYIRKVMIHMQDLSRLQSFKDWTFLCQDYTTILVKAGTNDLIYCDPPYLGRDVQYFQSWSEAQEHELFKHLSDTNAKFVLSTWYSDRNGVNPWITKLWSRFPIQQIDHFYSVGSKAEYRDHVVEALVTNF
jgi:DNA adenine methylase